MKHLTRERDAVAVSFHCKKLHAFGELRYHTLERCICALLKATRLFDKPVVLKEHVFIGDAGAGIYGPVYGVHVAIKHKAVLYDMFHEAADKAVSVFASGLFYKLPVIRVPLEQLLFDKVGGGAIR